MKTACAQDEAIVRELMRDVDQATTSVAERLRVLATEIGVLAGGEAGRYSLLEIGERMNAEAARLLAMGRGTVVVEPALDAYLGGPPATEEELALLARAGVPAAPVAGDPRPGVPVMSHESLGLRAPKGGTDGTE